MMRERPEPSGRSRIIELHHVMKLTSKCVLVQGSNEFYTTSTSNFRRANQLECFVLLPYGTVGRAVSKHASSERFYLGEIDYGQV